MKDNRSHRAGRWLNYVFFSLMAAIAGPGAAHALALASFTALPALDTQVDKPTAVAEDGQGRIYVAESMNNRVLILS